MTLDPNTIVYCFGCERRVRLSVTRREPTGEDGDLERWCLECLEGIDEHSQALLPKPADTPPSWEDGMSNFLHDDDDEGH